jgi:predicted nucleic acid-binding protein
MKYVLDSSVALKWVLAEPDSVQANRLRDDFRNARCELHAHSYLPLLRRACDLSSHARIGVYDCLYVALAEREACQLVTADSKLVSNLQKQLPYIVALASLP